MRIDIGGVVASSDAESGWILASLSDWLSLTDTKAREMERPLAHGMFDPGDDWRTGAGITVTLSYHGASQADVESALRILKSAAKVHSLIPCTVETDLGVTSRMVEVRKVEVPGLTFMGFMPNIVVDLLAPDPRAYGVVSSDGTGLPVHGGGLVFDTSPSTRWAGTPNASPSRLLDGGGNVIATNLATDPNATLKYGSGNAIQTDGKYFRYTGSMFNVFDASIPVGSILVIGFSEQPTNISVQHASSIGHFDTFAAFVVTASDSHAIYFDGQATLTGKGLYTATDWQAMQALGVTWFDGDSYPGHLLFPVGFGIPGSDGRARFVNTGTAPASVTMTVVGGGSEGITLKRVENGAVLTLSRPCNPDDRIIFDSSDGSVLLNGQAELSGWMTTDDYDRFDVEAGDTCTVQLGVMGEIVGVPRLTVSAAPAYW